MRERVIIEGPQSIRVKLKSRWADGTESLLFTPSEFLERLVALIPAPKFHTTRYYGVLASRSPHRRSLPDKSTPLIDTEHGANDGECAHLVESTLHQCSCPYKPTIGTKECRTQKTKTQRGADAARHGKIPPVCREKADHRPDKRG
ncbi:MAG: hypothetical protein FJY29_13725 [Betaproteobacteria bacterium]|nr:hypothetical protein [Betaproteobacteria bacterium]